MSEIFEFPEQLHRAFARLVAEEVQKTAHRHGLTTTDYVLALCSGARDDPHLFSGKVSLMKLYDRFAILVESTCSQLTLADLISSGEKTYLCYRIYLHSMIQREKPLTEPEARESLLKALRKYWLSCGSVLTPAREKVLIEGLRELVLDGCNRVQ